MRFGITVEMKKKIFVYASSLVLAIMIGAFFLYFDSVLEGIRFIFSVGFPFIVGVILAFILHHPAMWVEHKFFSKLKKHNARLLSVTIVFIIFLLILGLFFSTVIPSLIDSARTFASNVNLYSKTFMEYVAKFSEQLNLSEKDVEAIFANFDIVGKITSTVTDYLPKVADYSINMVRGLIKFILALVSAIYILLDLESLSRGIKQLNYAIFDKRIGNYLTLWIHDAKDVFEKYIVGSIIDSTIIGIACYLGVFILQIPYAPMIGFVVGLTNVIPVFGPFIGAIPVIVILLLINPIYALIFAIFILVLQQIDGNVIKPIVLGDQLGISGFWILFSVTIGGGIGGGLAGNIGAIFGMFLGVPVFALIYSAIRDFAKLKLKEKNIVIEDKKGALV